MEECVLASLGRRILRLLRRDRVSPIRGWYPREYRATRANVWVSIKPGDPYLGRRDKRHRPKGVVAKEK